MSPGLNFFGLIRLLCAACERGWLFGWSGEAETFFEQGDHGFALRGTERGKDALKGGEAFGAEAAAVLVGGGAEIDLNDTAVELRAVADCDAFFDQTIDDAGRSAEGNVNALGEGTHDGATVLVEPDEAAKFGRCDVEGGDEVLSAKTHLAGHDCFHYLKKTKRALLLGGSFVERRTSLGHQSSMHRRTRVAPLNHSRVNAES
jgi:hypothetical protein